MIAPDRVMVRDGSAVRNHGVERRALDGEPLRGELPGLAERMKREIRRGPVGIDVREAAGDLAAAAGRLTDRSVRPD